MTITFAGHAFITSNNRVKEIVKEQIKITSTEASASPAILEDMEISTIYVLARAEN